MRIPHNQQLIDLCIFTQAYSCICMQCCMACRGFCKPVLAQPEKYTMLKYTRDVILLLKQQIRIYESIVIVYWSGRAQYTRGLTGMSNISWFSHTDKEIDVFYIKS